MKRRVLLLCAGLICVWIAVVFIRRMLPVRPIIRAFPAAGIKTVVIRAAQAHDINIINDGAQQIQISGIPSGGAEGYHSPDPSWRETPAKSWGLDFVAKQYGNILVISTKKEIEYIHHHYALENLSVHVPKGIQVIKEEKRPSGDGEPNLKKPN